MGFSVRDNILSRANPKFWVICLIKNKKKGEKAYTKTSELCIFNFLGHRQTQFCFFYFWGCFMSILHAYKELNVCFLYWTCEEVILAMNRKKVSLLGIHDTGKVIVHYFIMCLKQIKQQVCVVGLFSLVPSAAEGTGRYWAEFGQEYCSIFPLISSEKYTLSLTHHSRTG